MAIYTISSKVVAYYQTSFGAIGRTWLYHQNALQAVIREIQHLGGDIHPRIKSLDEW